MSRNTKFSANKFLWSDSSPVFIVRRYLKGCANWSQQSQRILPIGSQQWQRASPIGPNNGKVLRQLVANTDKGTGRTGQIFDECMLTGSGKMC